MRSGQRSASIEAMFMETEAYSADLSVDIAPEQGQPSAY
jgi:hypothetical protein